MTDVSVAFDVRCQLGESPRWDARACRLLWADIYAGRLWTGRPDGEAVPLDVGAPLGCIAPTDVPGVYACATDRRVLLVGPGRGTRELAARPATGQRFNDGAVDPGGRLWVGTVEPPAWPPTGELFCLDPGSGLQPVLRGLRISNGLAWDERRARMYFVDSARPQVDVLDWADGTAVPGSRRPWVTFDPGDGSPDGIAIDAQGTVWVAMWGGGCVLGVSAEGRIVGKIPLPVPLVTACAFGGDGLQTMYVTTAQGDWPDFPAHPDPLAGAVFQVAMPVAGCAPTPLLIAGRW